MNNIKIKMLLMLLMLVPVPFACKDNNECRDDLHVEPYFDIKGMQFVSLTRYSINSKTQAINLGTFDQDYSNNVYPADSLALCIEVPQTELLFHSQNNLKKGFSFTQEALACIEKRNGYMGTLEKVDKIYISSTSDYDLTHLAGMDMSDIVEIFAYTTTGENSREMLNRYNENSPYEAPKRFYLFIKSPPYPANTTHQFVVTYLMKNEPGEASESYVITTPAFQLR